MRCADVTVVCRNKPSAGRIWSTRGRCRNRGVVRGKTPSTGMSGSRGGREDADVGKRVTEAKKRAMPGKTCLRRATPTPRKVRAYSPSLCRDRCFRFRFRFCHYRRLLASLPHRMLEHFHSCRALDLASYGEGCKPLYSVPGSKLPLACFCLKPLMLSLLHRFSLDVSQAFTP